jgi:hypothetical protein
MFIPVLTSTPATDYTWVDASRIHRVRVYQDSGPSDWICMLSLREGADVRLVDNASQATAQAAADSVLRLLGQVTL